ncbi:Mov34/MPN/PAD-1 family protein [Actinomadura scrupuli]|uniref:Mov34/MPN/PAD-1 family protein n=1 Tax=Actinomadura scrupuli TaxID=559629 RepID=UPI003D95A11C
MNDDLWQHFALLFPTRTATQELLEDVLSPAPEIPADFTATDFWRRLGEGMSDEETARLVAAARQQYPASAVLEEFQESGETWVVLVFIGDGDHEGHLSRTRRLLDPDAEVLYTSSSDRVTTIRVADRPDSELAEAVEQLTQPGVTVTFGRAGHRPYLVQELTVQGPDQQIFRVEDVPSTTTVGELAAGIVSQYTEGRPGSQRPTVIDRVLPDGSGRRTLNPDASLHDAGVGEDDQLRVGFQATAGAGLFQARVNARSRARDQLIAFAERTPGFALDAVDDPDFPARFVVTFHARSFGPPRDMLTRPLHPTVQDRHMVQITLPPDFPVALPTVTWVSPIFHPNVVEGAVCLPLDGPDLETTCQAVLDLAAYRNYEVRPEDFGGGGFLDLTAAAWTLSREGQERIIARGGTPRAALARPRVPLRIKLISEPHRPPPDLFPPVRAVQDPERCRITVRFDEGVAFDQYRSEEIEEGGFLLGRVHEYGEQCQVEVTEAVSATGTRATRTSWTMTDESFTALRDTIGDRLLVGWFHTHPRDAPAHPSAEDVALHRDLFPHPWQIAVLLNHDTVTCYQRDGQRLHLIERILRDRRPHSG